MPMPPCVEIFVNDPGSRQTILQSTYDDTVGAGDGVAIARRTGANPNDGDGAASETEKDIEVTQVNA